MVLNLDYYGEDEDYPRGAIRSGDWKLVLNEEARG
jgi:hypothetical protein